MCVADIGLFIAQVYAIGNPFGLDHTLTQVSREPFPTCLHARCLLCECSPSFSSCILAEAPVLCSKTATSLCNALAVWAGHCVRGGA